MKVNLQQHPEFFAGVSDIKQVAGGIIPSRFSRGNIWENASFMNECPAGVRIRFRTDSAKIRMAVLLGENPFEFEHGYFSIVIDNREPFIVEPPAPYPPDQFFEWNLDLPSGQKEIEIWFPSYRKVTIQTLELSDGAELSPLPPRTRTLFIGDSITQGYAAYPAYSYAARLSRLRNRDLLNLGIGGAKMPLALPDKILEEVYDEVVVAFGTNDINGGRNTEDFEKAANVTLEFFRRKPQTRLIVLSPIYIPKLENTDKADLPPRYSEILARTAQKYGASFINGTELVPHIPALFFDGCHPTNEGMRCFAENLREKLVD